MRSSSTQPGTLPCLHDRLAPDTAIDSPNPYSPICLCVRVPSTFVAITSSSVLVSILGCLTAMTTNAQRRVPPTSKRLNNHHEISWPLLLHQTTGDESTSALHTPGHAPTPSVRVANVSPIPPLSLIAPPVYLNHSPCHITHRESYPDPPRPGETSAISPQEPVFHLLLP